MGMFYESLCKLNRIIAYKVQTKSINVRLNLPIVSFTFDDCPRSSVLVGARILEEASVRGTYYICGGLTNGLENGIPCQTDADLNYLLSNNHEIASHLYHHKKCADLNIDELDSEIKKNKIYISNLAKIDYPQNFSYPFGSINLSSKRKISQEFSSGRGINSGLNVKQIDLACLKANALYSITADQQKISSLIDDAVMKKAWLIFYTHDVCEKPSKYGVTPSLLKFAVNYSLEQNCQILTVNESLKRITSHSNAPFNI